MRHSETLWIILAVLYYAPPTAIWVLSKLWLEKFEKYEFENRTTGGTVEFASFKEAKLFEVKKQLAAYCASKGIIAVFVLWTFGGMYLAALFSR